MTPTNSPAQTPAELLLHALPHLGETFTLDDAAARLRVHDPCGWPVPAHRDKLAWQLHDLALAGRLDTDGTHFRLPSRELLTLSEQGIPTYPVFDVTDWTVDIGESLSRSAAALTLLAHRLRRSLPQSYAGHPTFGAAAGHLLGSARFRDAVAAQSEPLDPAFLLAAAAREVAGLRDQPFATRLDLSDGQRATCRLLGWQSKGPELEQLRRFLDKDPTGVPVPEYAALLHGTDPEQWICTHSLSSAELYTYPDFEIRSPIVQAESPVRALGRSYLYEFTASQFAGSRAASDPLLTEYDPQVIGGGLMATRRDATPLLRSLGIPVEEVLPALSVRTRLEIARTEAELSEFHQAAESRILAEAVILGTGVEIGYRDEAGVETQRTATNPSLVNRSLLRGYCHLRSEDRMFRLDRITWIAAAQ